MKSPEATYRVVDLDSKSAIASGCGPVPRRGETVTITKMILETDDGFSDPEYSKGQTSTFEVADVVWPLYSASPNIVHGTSAALVYVYRRA